MSGASTVTVSIEVNVDPDTAFEVFTAEIDSWYKRGPYSWKDPRRAIGIRFEPGVDGRLLEVYDDASGEGFELGRVLAWEPGNRLVFSDLTSSTPPDPVSEVEVRFEHAAAGTRVTLEQRGLDRLPPERAAKLRKYGWITLIRWFDEHMGSPTRAGVERAVTAAVRGRR